MQELESEGDQLERSFHSYLQRNQERNRLLNKDAQKIWETYEIGKQLLSTSLPTKLKRNTLNIVPAAVPIVDVTTYVTENKTDEFEEDIADGLNSNFENPYRIYDLALRSRETSSQQVTRLKQSDIQNTPSLPTELESTIMPKSATKDHTSVPKLDTHSFPPSIEELNIPLILDQSIPLATEPLAIEPDKDQDIDCSETKVMLSISPLVDIDNVIPNSLKLEDTHINIMSEFNSKLTNAQDELNHMEIQKFSETVISNDKNTEIEVTIPVQNKSITNIKVPNQKNLAEISSSDSDVQISVANKSSSSENFWN